MRCYDGCPDSELQAVIDEIAAAERQLKRLCPEAHVTYFPVESRFQAHVWGRQLGEWSSSKLVAIHNAISAIEQQSKEALRV